MPSCYIQKEKPADLTKAPKTGQTKRIYPGLRDGDLGFGKICRTIFDRTLPSPSRAKAETFFLTQKVPSLGNILARCLKITPSFGFCRCAPVQEPVREAFTLIKEIGREDDPPNFEYARIVETGTAHKFGATTNENWDVETKPILGGLLAHQIFPQHDGQVRAGYKPPTTTTGTVVRLGVALGESVEGVGESTDVYFGSGVDFDGTGLGVEMGAGGVGCEVGHGVGTGLEARSWCRSLSRSCSGSWYRASELRATLCACSVIRLYLQKHRETKGRPFDQKVNTLRRGRKNGIKVVIAVLCALTILSSVYAFRQRQWALDLRDQLAETNKDDVKLMNFLSAAERKRSAESFASMEKTGSPTGSPDNI